MILFKHSLHKISVKTKQKLSESFEKFGDVEIPVLDFDKMTIAGHHQHMIKIATGSGDELADVNKGSLAEFRISMPKKRISSTYKGFLEKKLLL